ncbi:MAG TPA: hypothetical protein VJA21_33960, partial [Verrucomicrobiae bacterium]
MSVCYFSTPEATTGLSELDRYSLEVSSDRSRQPGEVANPQWSMHNAEWPPLASPSARKSKKFWRNYTGC